MEPQFRLGLSTLTQIAFDGLDLAPLRQELMPQCQRNVNSAGAMMDLSYIAQLEGHTERGLLLQKQALEICRSFRTHKDCDPQFRVLVLVAPIAMGGNTPVEFLLADSQFELVTYYLDPTLDDGTEVVLPDHDIAFCAVPADAEDADQLFAVARWVTRNTGKPVLNLPDNLVKPERDALPGILANIAGVRVSKTARLTRLDLKQMLHNKTEGDVLKDVGNYPYVVRPIGSHAGLGLHKIETPQDLICYLGARDEDTFFISEFINYASSADRAFRKYRIVLINGKPFPCHMAISDRWDVWYMNSEMAGSRSKRKEEADYMSNFDQEIGQRHLAGFETISERLGLNYVGLDCAEDPDGNLVVFEADNALIVHNMDCAQTFPYKTVHMQNIFKAFVDLLLDSCDEARVPLSVVAGQSQVFDHAFV